MKKKLLSTPRTFQIFNDSLIASCYNLRQAISKIFLPVILFFVSNLIHGQATVSHTFDTNNSIIVPNGLTSMNIQAWGGGGSGGGATNLPALQGRSGSGGGAGARATATITVTPGATISALVATAVSGTAGGNGTAGNPSTISGFQSSIFAPGGSGGLGNTAGGTLAGGAGGTVAAGAGTVTAGGDGGQGFTSGLAALFTSGAGGSSPGGGTGGASHTSVIGGVNENGLPGGIPGGGGSGGIITNTGEVRAGGAGAAGRVIISYTCPTYSLTSTSAAPTCTSSGTTVVTVTGAAANLPVGSYTVTYNRSTPSGSNLTATLSVATAGTGTFTATGLTTAGTSTITIISIRSEGCTSTVNSNNTASVVVSAPSVGGAVAGTTTICSGATSGTLTLSGHTGTIVRWQSSTDGFTTFTNIANTTTTYASGPLTATTQFRAVIQNGVCATANSTPAVITVNPLPQGSLTANGPFCDTGAGQLTFTASAGTGPYTVVYNDGTANRTVANVVSGTPFNVFTTPVTSTTTYTLVSVTGANSCVRTTGFTGPSATITVGITPRGSLTSNGPLCSTGTGQLTFTATEGMAPFTIVYNDGTANRTVTGVVSGTPFNTFINPVTSNTTYTLVSVTGADSCVRTSGFPTGPTTITVNPSPQGSLTANGPFCATGAGQLTFTATAGTGPYTVVYNDGTANRTVTGVVSGTPFNTAIASVTNTTTYTLVSVTGANSCVRTTGFTAGSATITVNPLPQGSLTANGPFCTTGAGQLTFTATAGTGPYTVVYNDGTANRTVSGVTSGTPFNTFTTPVTATTTYTLVSVTGANSCIRSSGFTTGSATITINPLPQGSLTANGPFCETGAGQLTFTATAGTGPYTVVYNDGTANRTANNVTSGTPFNTFATPVTATTTYTLVSVTGANSCIRNSGFSAGSATITVNPLPQGSLTANGPFCATGAGQLTFTATAGTGPYTVVYNDGTANRTVNNVTSGTPFSTFTTPVTATTTYTLVSVTGANSCVRSSGFTAGSATITVNPLPQGSLTANGPFCETGAGQLTFTATAGTGPYTVVYNDGTANRTVNNVTSGTPFSTFTTPVTATTTYTLVSITGANSCIRNSGFTAGSATITVNPLPQGSLTANGPFCATGAGQLTFTSTAGTGPYTIIYNDGTANRTVNNVTSGTPFNTFTTPVTATTTYTLVSVTGTNSCVRTSAFTGGSATITVNPTPAPSFTAQPAASVCVNTFVTYTTQSGQSNYVWTVSGTLGNDYNVVSGSLSNTSDSVTLEWLTIGNKTVTVGYTSLGCPSSVNASNTTTVIRTVRGVVNGGTAICSGSPSPLLTLNGYTGTIVRWEYAEAIPYVWQPISHTGNTYQPGILATSTSYRAVVQNGSCPEEGSIETRIDVEPKPSTPGFGTIVQPTCVSSVGSVVLTGLPSTPNWTITQTGTVNQTYTATGTTYTINNLAPGTYTFTVYNTSICLSDPTASLEIAAPSTNIWNGTSWSKGSPPSITDAIRFSGDYSTTGNLSGCSCVIDPGVTVTVNSNHTLTITNSVTNSGGSFIFENNSSLYQTTDAVNTGNITYRRNTMPVRRYDFTYWSSPVTRLPAFTLQNLSPGTLLDKYYKYNAAGDSWVIINYGTEEMAKGVGYNVRAPQSFSTTIPAVYNAEFIGVPNNGPVSVPLGGVDKWNLIGNPYPSAVYADQFIVDNAANLYGTLYFWTHNSLPSGSVPGTAQNNYTSVDYAIYNLSGSTTVGNMSGTGATSPGNTAEPLGYIAAGQSFFVQSKNASSAAFTNSMRVPGNNSQFYRTTASSAIERHRVWINLRNKEGAFKQILIGYVEGATNGWDTNYDAVTMDSNKFLDFYSINADKKLVIQGRALPFTGLEVIPLGYKLNISGEFFIEIDHADGHLNVIPVFLKDKATGITHNLQKSNYTFTSNTGVFTDRFELSFGLVNLDTEDFEKTDSAIYVSVKDKQITVNSQMMNENLKDIAVYDISGKLLYDKKNIGNAQYEISNLQSAEQVLVLKITLDNGSIDTKKIIFR
ncbi:T9SS sorting signal type C domain-containing protein [Flavobacterium foetidum]|uniref:T9SS sorting signal type C domain-containing protein n=1 Tax=Flavobacterium foetidum TaxID=2026681 RepID=UPI0010756284|nr:T9SS sorting signal type C domain-containing protein [Flavobacterium foetidum]KAF2514543.1 T9SS sorting signal type C domain-containing protein [Flavobacterium foetidum]